MAAKERRQLAIEKEASGAPEILKVIEEKQAKAEEQEKTLSVQNRPFYCALCDKQCTCVIFVYVRTESFVTPNQRVLRNQPNAQHRAVELAQCAAPCCAFHSPPQPPCVCVASHANAQPRLPRAS